jgi:hypothetical protein
MGDAQDGHPDETRWMTYGELALTEGISKASAARLAVRRFGRARRAMTGVSAWRIAPSGGSGALRHPP